MRTPSRPGARLLPLLAAASVSVAVLSGCSSILDPNAGKGEPIPADLTAEKGKPSLPDPSEEGVKGAEDEQDLIVGILRYDREKAVLDQAKTDGEISSTCTPSSETVYECTVTFEGQPVRSTIDVSDSTSFSFNGGDSKFATQNVRFTVTEQDVVITDRAVRLEMLHTVKSSAKGTAPMEDPRCDEDFPALQVVAENEDAPEGHCYGRPADADGWPSNRTEEYSVSGATTHPTVFKS